MRRGGHEDGLEPELGAAFHLVDGVLETCAVGTSRGDTFRMFSTAQSLLTRMASRSTSGVRNDELQRPRDGKITSPQIPSVSRSFSRSRASRAPGARLLASMNSWAAIDGILRRKDCPSMCTVSQSPSGSFSDRGTSAASRGGRFSAHRSSGSRKCESPELAQIIDMRFPSLGMTGARQCSRQRVSPHCAPDLTDLSTQAHSAVVNTWDDAPDLGTTWQRPPVAPPEGDPFAVLIDQFRTLQDVITGAAPPPDVLREAAARTAGLVALLAPHVRPERDQVTGQRRDLPGRGQTLAPVLLVDESTATTVAGRVTFGRFYLGSNNAAHGGALPLFFDEVLGRLSNSVGDRSRTAYLHVNYRAITPIGRELRFRAAVDRVDGRKRFLTGTLHDEDTLCCDAEGLFVVLRAGQP
jgi:hypothetical protein